MRVTGLKLANLRGIESAEFRFLPGFNLIAGINGVGKSSVLDALSVSLSPIVKHVNSLRTIRDFSADDIRIGTEALTVECGIEIDGEKFTYLIHKPRESSVPRQKTTGMPRLQVHETPEKSEFMGRTPRLATDSQVGGRPFAVFFGTRRAVPTDRSPSKGSSAGGVQAALAEALNDRRLRLAEFAEWMRVQGAMRRENLAAGRVLAAFEDAVTRFLPGYSNLRVDRGKPPRLLIDHGRTTLDVRQLSDGERGSLAMVLDLTRRIAQANPKMDTPASTVEAVVLIDELDLHLHPTWQQTIVRNLRATFPKCQFIATTHSPQVVASVEPEQIALLTKVGVSYPDRSLGIDSNWILRHLMETDDRPEDAAKAIQAIEALIKKGSLKKARAAIVRAKKKGLDLPEWSVLEARMARLELLAK